MLDKFYGRNAGRFRVSDSLKVRKRDKHSNASVLRYVSCIKPGYDYLYHKHFVRHEGSQRELLTRPCSDLAIIRKSCLFRVFLNQEAPVKRKRSSYVKGERHHITVVNVLHNDWAEQEWPCDLLEKISKRIFCELRQGSGFGLYKRICQIQISTPASSGLAVLSYQALAWLATGNDSQNER